MAADTKLKEKLKNKFAGKFIVLDGPDGCGKSTQTKLLAQWLEEQSVSVETFRDPGTTAIGEKIRKILLNPENAAATLDLALVSEHLGRRERALELYRLAARLDPALAAAHEGARRLEATESW